jgi:hypothetical protein
MSVAVHTVPSGMTEDRNAHVAMETSLCHTRNLVIINGGKICHASLLGGIPQRISHSGGGALESVYC